MVHFTQRICSASSGIEQYRKEFVNALGESQFRCESMIIRSHETGPNRLPYICAARCPPVIGEEPFGQTVAALGIARSSVLQPIGDQLGIRLLCNANRAGYI